MSFIHRTLSSGRSIAQCNTLLRTSCASLNHSQQRRSIHMNTTPSTDISQMFSGILSADTAPPPDRINTLLNMIYMHSPRTVTPFNLHCRTMRERWIVRGLRVGPKNRQMSRERGPSIVLVSGLQPQDTSSVAVSLYVAAALSRSPLACDVSVVPVAFPKEYEKRWRMDQAFSVRQPTEEEEDTFSLKSIPSEEHAAPTTYEVDSSRDVTEGPLKHYIARLGKFFVNTTLEQSPNGSLFTFKDTSLSRFKGEDSLLPSNEDMLVTSSVFVGNNSSLLDPMTRSPTFVIQLKNSCAMDEDQLVYRADEVVKAIHELIENSNHSIADV